MCTMKATAEEAGDRCAYIMVNRTDQETSGEAVRQVSLKMDPRVQCTLSKVPLYTAYCVPLIATLVMISSTSAHTETHAVVDTPLCHHYSSCIIMYA